MIKREEFRVLIEVVKKDGIVKKTQFWVIIAMVKKGQFWMVIKEVNFGWLLR